MEFNGGCVVAKPETLQEGVADFAKAVGLSAALAVGAHAAGGKNLNRAASYPGGKVTSEMVSASSNMEDYSKRVREIFEQLMKERPNRDMQMAYDIATSRALAEIATEKAAKKDAYYKLPRYFRAVAYFCIRYFLKLGFLDGLAGFRWHFWQGLWYRWIVDREIGRVR